MLFGQIILEITCADCTTLLNKINNAHIDMRNIECRDELRLCMTISACDYLQVRKIIAQQGGNVHTKKYAFFLLGYIYPLLRRPVLLLAFLVLLVATVCLPRYILFVSVTGNIAVPTTRIIEAAGECGLFFGRDRSSIRSEVIKNALLQKIPDLQWVGVNTRGCVATISVREKTSGDETENAENSVSSIVALRDGIIRECVVYKGNPLCATGQAVKKGQILVSAYSECGNVIKATQAEAEISALTYRDLKIVTLSTVTVKDTAVKKQVNYSLCIGKKLINLSKHSGNSNSTCDKIYVEKFLRLPGGFTLPISLITETITQYDLTKSAPQNIDGADWLCSYAHDYLKAVMVAGDIISEEVELFCDAGVLCLQGNYTCVEMIGQKKYEQTLLEG